VPTAENSVSEVIVIFRQLILFANIATFFYYLLPSNRCVIAYVALRLKGLESLLHSEAFEKWVDWQGNLEG